MAGFEEDLLDIEGPPLPPVEKVFDFYVTTLGGMEDVALEEMHRRLKRLTRVHVVRGRRLGRIFFHYERSPKQLLSLRSVENVFALLADIGGVTAGQPGLLRIARRIGQVDLIPAAVLHDVLFGIKDRAGFQLACTTGKGHRFSASELHHVVQTILQMKYDVGVEAVAHPYRLHLQVLGNRALFGLQLSDRSLRERIYRQVRIDREMPPLAAYSLMQLANLRRRDVCIDLRCGGGLALIEAALEVRPHVLVGCEAYPEVLAGARENARLAGVAVDFVAAEATGLPMRTGSADCVMGCLIRRRGEPLFALPPVLQEVQRVLAADGRAVMVVEDQQAMGRALDDLAGLRKVHQQPLHVQGRHYTVFLLQRTQM